ncbi:MAG: type II toxin-antitoxin system RelE/ParE family toxin [bacterium]|nr:type II toxin-antitoxin system RelE/ParE family toxin [bacterium]
MDYYFKPSAIKNIKRLPKLLQKRILGKLDFYTNGKDPIDFAERLNDKTLGSFRFRVGDYRIIFDVADEKVIILAIGLRRDIYKR